MSRSRHGTAGHRGSMKEQGMDDSCRRGKGRGLDKGMGMRSYDEEQQEANSSVNACVAGKPHGGDDSPMCAQAPHCQQTIRVGMSGASMQPGSPESERHPNSGSACPPRRGRHK